MPVYGWVNTADYTYTPTCPLKPFKQLASHCLTSGPSGGKRGRSTVLRNRSRRPRGVFFSPRHFCTEPIPVPDNSTETVPGEVSVISRQADAVRGMALANAVFVRRDVHTCLPPLMAYTIGHPARMPYYSVLPGLHGIDSKLPIHDVFSCQDRIVNGLVVCAPGQGNCSRLVH